MVYRRSIPAHAGEPGVAIAHPRLFEVYPRPRGGTRQVIASLAANAGLSPPTRGNRRERRSRTPCRGSIPAHAGEPRWRRPASAQSAVYPRPRGGTPPAALIRARTIGLSPPTRGNPSVSLTREHGDRSIPAHAGEPYAWRAWRSGTAGNLVYPRPRGGTAIKDGGNLAEQGLSPPTRGNPILSLRTPNHAGSIPAHAGEPVEDAGPATLAQVYPRPRGGTSQDCSSSAMVRGLSPPTRGNPSSDALTIA